MQEFTKANPEVLFFILVMGFFIFGRLLIRQLMDLRKRLKNNKLYKQKMVEVEEMKKRGEYHDWVKLPVGATEAHVCSKTGYCPTIDGFFPQEYLDYHLKRKTMNDEFDNFREAEMTKLVSKYSLGREVLEEIAEDIYSIKKNFTLSQLENLTKELRTSIDEKE